MASDSRHVLGRLDTLAPPGSWRRVEAWRAGGRKPATPALATSVVLLRERAQALEVYLMRRHRQMAFAPGMTVFPGGRVDPVDQDHPSGPLLAAAVRETAEETSVALAPEALVPWARWITPEFEPLRYDTYFYVALLPAGQQAEDVSGEADRTWWSTAKDALDSQQDGSVRLMPPTASIVMELAECPDWAGVLAAATDRRIEPVQPELIMVDGVWHFDFGSGAGTE